MTSSRVVFILLFLVIIASCRSKQTTEEQSQPITRWAVTSCTHVGFMDALGVKDQIVAVCNKDLIYTPLNDSVTDIGDSMSPSVERLIQSGAEAVMVVLYQKDVAWVEQARQMGIRIVVIDEWKEQTPLKRAAWIKEIGRLTGTEKRADSIYSSVEQSYNRLKAEAAQQAKSQEVLTGNNFRGTWYVPAGNTYMGELLTDAGFNYVYANDSSGKSLPLTIEQVIRTFGEAPVWVGSNGNSLEELKQMDEKHTWFKAYKNQNVYTWNGQTTTQGANNFWERGVVHPEEILQDLIAIKMGEISHLKYASKLN